MNTTKAHRIITVSAIGVLFIGIANSAFKSKELPSVRFFVGVGVIYLSLSALAEAEPEIANAFAIAILTGTLLSSDADKGWLSYFQSNRKEEMAAPGKESLGVNIPRREPHAGEVMVSSTPPGSSTRERAAALGVGHSLVSTLSVLPPIPGILPSAFDKRRDQKLTTEIGLLTEKEGCSCG